MQRKTYTLITGASSGIGKALAEASARRGQNLLLVALPNSDLTDVAKEIREQYEVEVRHLGIDLTEINAPEKIYRWCILNCFSVNILINNAGIGAGGAFEEYSLGFYEKLMQLNIIALVSLTRLFIPELQKHQESYILNVSSLGGRFDIPFKTVYSASKTFVYSFSRSLREELKNTPVKITVLCPNGVNTNDEVKRRVKEIGWAAKIAFLEPDYVADLALRKMYQGKAAVFPGVVTKIYLLLKKFLPYPLQLRIMKYFFQRSRNKDIPSNGGQNFDSGKLEVIPEYVNH